MNRTEKEKILSKKDIRFAAIALVLTILALIAVTYYFPAKSEEYPAPLQIVTKRHPDSADLCRPIQMEDGTKMYVNTDRGWCWDSPRGIDNSVFAPGGSSDNGGGDGQ